MYSYFPNLIISISLFLTLINQDPPWSTPEVIPGYHPDTWPPILVADQNSFVHAFSSQWAGEKEKSDKVIMYNRWTYDNGWTLPVNILLAPINEARILDAFIDSKGVIHVIFWGGNNISADIYYSRAPLANADNAGFWTTPVIIAENAGDPESAKFIIGDEDNIGILFHGRQIGEGVYFVKLMENVAETSNANPVHLTGSDELLPFSIQVHKDDLGWHHAIWNVINNAGQGRGIYYSKYKNGDLTWSEPFLIEEALEEYGVLTPTIIEHEGILFAIYSGIVMRQSFDNGLTWESVRKIFFRHVGVNGALSPVIDSNSDLHLFFGQRITSSPDIHGLWHSKWINHQWTEPEALVKNPQVTDLRGTNSFDPFEARAVVSQGNVILVTWRTDPGLKGNGVWYSYKKLNAPENPIILIPQKQLSEEGAEKISKPNSTYDDDMQSSTKFEILDVASPGTLLEPNVTIMLGGLLTTIFIFGVLFRKSIKSKP